MVVSLFITELVVKDKEGEERRRTVLRCKGETIGRYLQTAFATAVAWAAMRPPSEGCCQLSLDEDN